MGGEKGPKYTAQTPSGQTRTQQVNHTFSIVFPSSCPRSCQEPCAPPPHLSWEEQTRTPLDFHPEKLACLVAWLNILTEGSRCKSLKPTEHSSWWGCLCCSHDRNQRLEAKTAQSPGRKAKPKVSLELPTGGVTGSPQSCGTGQQTCC